MVPYLKQVAYEKKMVEFAGVPASVMAERRGRDRPFHPRGHYHNPSMFLKAYSTYPLALDNQIEGLKSYLKDVVTLTAAQYVDKHNVTPKKNCFGSNKKPFKYKLLAKRCDEPPAMEFLKMVKDD